MFVVCFVQSSMNIKHSCKWMGNVSKMHLYFSWTTAYPAPGNAEKIKSWKTQYQNSHYHSKCVLLESIFRSNVLLISKPSSQTKQDATLTQTSSALLLSSDSVLNCTSCTRLKSCHLLTDCVPMRVYSMTLSAQWVRLLFLGCWAVRAAVVICLLSWLYVGLGTSCRSNKGDVVG